MNTHTHTQTFTYTETCTHTHTNTHTLSLSVRVGSDWVGMAIAICFENDDITTANHPSCGTR